MRVKSSLIPAMTAILVMVLLTACVAVDTTSGTPTPTPTTPRQAPTLTPVPPEARQTAVNFARSYQQISQDWDQFHSEFSQWRASLDSCDRSSAEAALGEFAANFNEVLREARNLPRSSSTRDLSDQLIKAAEGQGEVLRQLRDRWQPSNTALFDAVETQRSAAVAAQQEVLDKLSDSSESTDSGAVDEARSFSTAFEQVNQNWEQFHNSYSSLRGQQSDLTPTEMSTRLSGLVDEFSGIVSAIGDLPSSDTTDEMSDSLVEAANAEDAALKVLRDSFQSQAEMPEGEPGAGGPPAEEPPAEETPTEEPTGGEASTPANGADPFATLDGLVEKSNDVRTQVQNDLAAILEDAPAREITDIDNFRQQYDVLVRQWNEFYQSYDEWRRSDGGCNRTEVIDRLGQYSLRFEGIAREVRDLPRSSFVRPMSDTLVEAAQREEEALRVLRNTWRPFATDAYRALDQERINADELRRQAEVGIQELLERFSIPASEI